MTYNVNLTDQAKRDLHNIYEYISFSLLEPGTAKKMVRRILDALRSLTEMPGRFPIYPEEPWKSRGLRRINIGNYCGFYVVNENNVQVIRIMYGGRDIANILNDSR
jgi:toxin ParE1/3/4